MTDRILYSIKLANYITDLQRNDGFENLFYLALYSYTSVKRRHRLSVTIDNANKQQRTEANNYF